MTGLIIYADIFPVAIEAGGSDLLSEARYLVCFAEALHIGGTYSAPTTLSLVRAGSKISGSFPAHMGC